MAAVIVGDVIVGDVAVEFEGMASAGTSRAHELTTFQFAALNVIEGAESFYTQSSNSRI